MSIGTYIKNKWFETFARPHIKINVTFILPTRLKIHKVYVTKIFHHVHNVFFRPWNKSKIEAQSSMHMPFHAFTALASSFLPPDSCTRIHRSKIWESVSSFPHLKSEFEVARFLLLRDAPLCWGWQHGRSSSRIIYSKDKACSHRLEANTVGWY